MSKAEHEQLRQLAERDGLTIVEVLRRLLREERQRRMGLEDAERGLTDEEATIVVGAAHQVAEIAAVPQHAGRRHRHG